MVYISQVSPLAQGVFTGAPLEESTPSFEKGFSPQEMSQFMDKFVDAVVTSIRNDGDSLTQSIRQMREELDS